MAAELTWLGHATWLIVTGGRTCCSIRFSTTRPPRRSSRRTSRPQYILVSHGHFDHVADAAKIATPHRRHGRGEFRDLRVARQAGRQRRPSR